MAKATLDGFWPHNRLCSSYQPVALPRLEVLLQGARVNQMEEPGHGLPCTRGKSRGIEGGVVQEGVEGAALVVLEGDGAKEGRRSLRHDEIALPVHAHATPAPADALPGDREGEKCGVAREGGAHVVPAVGPLPGLHPVDDEQGLKRLSSFFPVKRPDP